MIQQLAEYFSSSSNSPGVAGSKATRRPLMRTSDVRELAEPIENLILKYPAAALASAFMVGVVVAWWIKRK